MTENKNSLEYGVARNKENLKELNPVLNEWIRVVQEYSDAFDGENDACWWSNERANVGILAAAAWRTEGWVSLEEYSTQKYGKNGKLKNGRCDLYVGKKNHEAYFEIEAKVVWEDINGIQEIENRLIDALDDASRLSNDAGQKIAACFALPYIKKSENTNDGDVTSQLTGWLKIVGERVTCDALAWVFPKKNRQLTRDGYFYPGVVLMLRKYQP